MSLKIPWTRITSEPVVVTINTLEFVAKLKDSDKNSRKPTPDTTLNNSVNLNTSNSQNLISEQQQQQQMPSGYIQNIISKLKFILIKFILILFRIISGYY